MADRNPHVREERVYHIVPAKGNGHQPDHDFKEFGMGRRELPPLVAKMFLTAGRLTSLILAVGISSGTTTRRNVSESKNVTSGLSVRLIDITGTSRSQKGGISR